MDIIWDSLQQSWSGYYHCLMSTWPWALNSTHLEPAIQCYTQQENTATWWHVDYIAPLLLVLLRDSNLVICPHCNGNLFWIIFLAHCMSSSNISTYLLNARMVLTFTRMVYYTTLLLIKELILQLKKKKKVRLWLWDSLVLAFIPSSEILSRVVSLKVIYSKLMRTNENRTQLLGNGIAEMKWESRTLAFNWGSEYRSLLQWQYKDAKAVRPSKKRCRRVSGFFSPGVSGGLCSDWHCSI